MTETEAEWLTCEDPKALFEHLESCPPLTQRKMLLFAVVCCRRFTSLFPEPVFVNALTVSERFADGRATEAELATVDRDVSEFRDESEGASLLNPESVSLADAVFYAAKALLQATAPDSPEYPLYCRLDDLLDGITSAILYVSPSAPKGGGERWVEFSQRASPGEERALADLVRDIFGNPFRPVSLDPAWLTSTVVQLARGIYDDRAFDRMPILADALQDAGCDNDDILEHCRDAKATHVRGCWVVDLVLGKE